MFTLWIRPAMHRSAMQGRICLSYFTSSVLSPYLQPKQCLIFFILCKMSFLATKIEKESSNEDSSLAVQAMCGEAPRHLVMFPTNCGGHAGMVVGHV
jgi:hypothetical protein